MRYRMNPDACSELIEKLGSKSAAARHIGVPRQTFAYWADSSYRDRHSRYGRERYASDREYRKRALERMVRRYDNMSHRERQIRLLAERRRKAVERLSERGHGGRGMNALGDAMFGNLLSEVEENLNGKV